MVGAAEWAVGEGDIPGRPLGGRLAEVYDVLIAQGDFDDRTV